MNSKERPVSGTANQRDSGSPAPLPLREGAGGGPGFRSADVRPSPQPLPATNRSRQCNTACHRRRFGFLSPDPPARRSPRREEGGQVVHAERKSNVLTPSRLWCIANQPTINITRGCLHRCTYCYARGYRAYPGDGRVVVYTNTAARLKAELDRRRKRPECVYFSPSSDAFQAIPEVLEQTYAAMETLLKRQIPVSFLTKGRIPRRFFDLFVRRAPFVHGQIDITTLDERIQEALEPFAAPPSQRLLDLRRLVRTGIRAEARLDPLIPNLTDRPREIRRLLAALSAMGVQSVAVNFLVLRPAIRANLYRDLRGWMDLKPLFRLYGNGVSLPLRGHGALVWALPTDYRQRAYDFIRETAGEFGVEVKVCGCKNPDLAEEACNINGRALAAEPTLFAV